MQRHRIQDATGVIVSMPGSSGGAVQAAGFGAPTASIGGYAKGCLFFDITNGVLYYNSGTNTSATWSVVGNIAGVGTGYKIARGEVTLDGSNPTSVTTGLATVTAASASLKASTTPGDDPSWLSVDYAGSVAAGQLDIYAWKNTGGTDPTLVASTNNAAVISWLAIGT